MDATRSEPRLRQGEPAALFAEQIARRNRHVAEQDLVVLTVIPEVVGLVRGKMREGN